MKNMPSLRCTLSMSRGVDSSYYIKNANSAAGQSGITNPEDAEYLQADKPVRELEKVSGRVQWAVYLLSRYG